MNFIDIYSDIDIFYVIYKNIGEYFLILYEIVKNVWGFLKDVGK